MNIETLAEKCSSAGADTLTPSSLTNLERTGTSRGPSKVSVHTWLTLALVLDCAPLDLLADSSDRPVVLTDHLQVKSLPALVFGSNIRAAVLAKADALRAEAAYLEATVGGVL
jgi:hypothetical protein